MIFGRFLLIVATALLAFAPAGAQSAPVVPGPAQDRALAWRLERSWSVGGASDTDLELDRIFAKDLAGSGGSGLFVIDRTEVRVVEYDSLGRRVRTFGSKGAGPGEFEYPSVVVAAADGSVHVYDASRSVIVVFSSDGRFLREDHVSARVRSPRPLPGGGVIGLRQRYDTSMLVTARDEALTTLIRHVLMPAKSTPPVCHLTDWLARPVFDSELAWTARGGTIAATVGAFRISLFDGTEVTRVLTREAPRRPTSHALAVKHLGEGETMQLVGERPCIIPAEMILSVAEIAKELPAYESLLIAPDQRIWAVRFTVRGEPGLADIYDPVRGYLGTLPLGKVRPAAVLSNGSLVSLERDADDVPIVVVYRLRTR